MGCPNPGQNGDFVIRELDQRTCPPSQDDAFQVRPRFVICQGSIDTGSQGKDSRSATDDDAAAQSQPKSRFGEPPLRTPGTRALIRPEWRLHSLSIRMTTTESHSHLQVLLRDELRQWVDEHKIESQGKRPTRMAIAGAAKSEQPSKEDIESIVTERKSKRNTKAA
ncbi:hypothetical protein EDB85DRAFT_1897976 [Lactarius pseudohatsudake]|nr:hypothetical protein EDB85DRAFT_1897976 [Lactarius pseudohatsudake]